MRIGRVIRWRKGITQRSKRRRMASSLYSASGLPFGLSRGRQAALSPWLCTLTDLTQRKIYSIEPHVCVRAVQQSFRLGQGRVHSREPGGRFARHTSSSCFLTRATSYYQSFISTNTKPARLVRGNPPDTRVTHLRSSPTLYAIARHSFLTPVAPVAAAVAADAAARLERGLEKVKLDD